MHCRDATCSGPAHTNQEHHLGISRQAAKRHRAPAKVSNILYDLVTTVTKQAQEQTTETRAVDEETAAH